MNIYTQSFARLVWSQAQLKPQSKLAQLSAQQVPVPALNLVVGCCALFTLLIYWLHLPLGALITYANGIFILIYLLCMLAGIRSWQDARNGWRCWALYCAADCWRWSAGKRCMQSWCLQDCGCYCHAPQRYFMYGNADFAQQKGLLSRPFLMISFAIIRPDLAAFPFQSACLPAQQDVVPVQPVFHGYAVKPGSERQTLRD